MNIREVIELVDNSDLDFLWSDEYKYKSIVFNGNTLSGKSKAIEYWLEKVAQDESICGVANISPSGNSIDIADMYKLLISNTISRGGESISFSSTNIAIDKYYALVKECQKNIININQMLSYDNINNVLPSYISANNIEAYKAVLNTSLDKKSTIEIMSAIPELFAKNFVLDLLNHFLPLCDQYPNYQSYFDEKIFLKFVIIVDHHDFNSKFFEFLENTIKIYNNIEYNFDNVTDNFDIRKLFDIKIVYSSRLKIEGNKNIEVFDLEYLSESDIQSIFHDNDINFAKYGDIVTDASAGAWDLIEYAIEEIRNERFDKQEYISYCNKYYLEAFLKYYDNIDLQILYLLTNLNEISKISLYPFSSYFGDESEKISYFLSREDLIFNNGKGNLFAEKLKMAFSQGNLEIDKGIKEIIDFVNKNISILKDFSLDELSYLRILAYFKSFSVESVFYQLYELKSDEVIKLFQNQINIFTKNTFTFSMKQEYKEILDKLNHLIDGDNYGSIKQFTHKLWVNYSQDLQNDTNSRRNEIKTTSAEIERYENELAKKGKENEENQESINKLKFRIKEINALLIPLQPKSKESFNYIFLGLVAIFMIGVISPETLFNRVFQHEETIDLARYLSLFFAIVFLGLSSKYLIRTFKRLIKDKEIKALQKEIDIISNELKQLEEQFRINSADITASNSKVNELNRDIVNTNKIISENISRLEESFI